MGYVVVVFDRKQEWWARGEDEYDYFAQADVVRSTIIRKADVDPYLIGNKIEVWPLKRWENLPIGYKHPDCRSAWDEEKAFKSASLPSENKEREKAIHFSDLGNAMAQALKEAGL